MMRLATFGFLITATQSGPAELVKKLGNENPAVRDDAERRLIEAGPAAADELKKGAASPDAEVRERARRILKTLDRRENLKRNGLECVQGLSDEEERLLKMHGLVPILQGAGERFDEKQDGLPEKPQDPWTIWNFIDPAFFPEPAVRKGRGSVWLVQSEDRIMLIQQAAKKSIFPRLYLLKLSKKLPKDVAWDSKTHTFPALAPVTVEKNWRHLYLADETGALHTFCWDQDKPFPSLRRAFIKDSFLILCIDYQ